MKNEKIFYFNNQKGKIKQKNFFLYFELIIVLLKISFVDLISLKNKRKLNNYYSEIKLVIQVSEQGYESHNINILNDGFNTVPDEVLVNGNRRYDCDQKCELKNGKYNVTLRFGTQINSCYKMFDNIDNIIEADLSNFDASEVTTMFFMFAEFNIN